MAASKLDYLQKYLSGDKKEKKRRKKEASGSKKSTVKCVLIAIAVQWGERDEKEGITNGELTVFCV